MYHAWGNKKWNENYVWELSSDKSLRVQLKYSATI